jgi:PAS domain S-box-containing protein
MPKRPTPSPDAAALRRRAEARVRATAARTPGPRTDADTQRLLHELQVHQVELELQNEELRQAREAGEAGLARYTALYDLAPVAYLTLDRAGAIRSVNLTGATLLGLGRAAVGGTAFSWFLPVDARPAFEAVLGTAFNDSGKHAVCEVPLQPTAGPLRFVRIEATAAEAGDECRVVLVDITDRQRLGFEALLADLSARFVHVPADQVDRMIEEAQRRIVQALGLDRSTLLQRAEDADDLVITHAWAEPDFAAQPGLFAKRDFPWVHQTLLRGGTVRFATLEELPAEAKRDQESFRTLHQKSIVIFPLAATGRVFGALSFGTLAAEREWSDVLVQRLQLMADIFANALARQRSEQALQRALADVTRLKRQLEAENAYLRAAAQAQPIDIVGNSPALKRVLSQVDHVAPTDTSVVLLGETGTGKGLLAHLLHRRSRRRDRTMVTLNCSALPPTLIEAELFGREKGAYTGALTRQAGRFELADGSTIFLDEIAELPLDLQVKLLRVLDDGQLERIGSTKTLTVDVRVIAATNRDLAQRVADGKFREDLYYRLNVFPIVVPPLRERGEDIPLLVWTFAKHFGQALGKPVERIPQATMDALRSYPWPGNIRELRNVIERAVILSESSTLQVLVGAAAVPVAVAPPTLAATERAQILAALAQTGWRIRGPAGAAALLGLKPTTLESRIQKLGLQRPS